jgi:hypothetical protein
LGKLCIEKKKKVELNILKKITHARKKIVKALVDKPNIETGCFNLLSVIPFVVQGAFLNKLLIDFRTLVH